MMCKYKHGTKIKHSNRDRKKNGDKYVDALSLFYNDQRMYKKNDYRCLKPVETKPPEKWPHYEMKGFRAANTEDEIRRVKEIPYDNNFFNFEDPNVFEAFTSRKMGRQLWRKTYGYDFISINKSPKHPVRAYQCIRHCFMAEYGNFANRCRKRGGFFKCCLAK